MTKLQRWGSIFLVALVSTACDSPPGSETEKASPGSAQTDGLFVPRGGTSRLTDAPLTVVGTSPALPLAGAQSAVFFGDGIAIANSTSNELLILDSEGLLVSRRGGRGQGPGEYIFLGGVARYGDGLVTWDRNHGRVTLHDAQGQHVGQTRTAIRSAHDLRIVGTFGNSALTAHYPRGSPGYDVDPAHLERPTITFEILNLSSGEKTLELDLPGEELWMARDWTETGTLMSGDLPVIFGRRVVAAVTNERAYLADTDSLVLSSYNEQGDSQVISLGQAQQVTVPEEWVQHVRDTLRTNAVRKGNRGGRFLTNVMNFELRLLTDLPAHSTLPSFSELSQATDGTLWIRGYSSPMQDHDVWVQLSEAWEPLQWVEIPKDLKVLDFAEGRVLVWRRGAFLEDIIEVYEIVG